MILLEPNEYAPPDWNPTTQQRSVLSQKNVNLSNTSATNSQLNFQNTVSKRKVSLKHQLNTDGYTRMMVFRVLTP